MHIATVLPQAEYYERKSAGAVSLFVKEFADHSAYKHSILGVDVPSPFEGNDFYTVKTPKLRFSKRTVAYARSALKILNTIKPDQVDVHNRIEIFLQLADHFKTNIFFHNDPLTMRGSRSVAERKEILGKAHRVFCVSEYIKGNFLQGIEDNADHVLVMPNGVKIDPQIPFDEKKNVILYVGRLIEEKGVHLLVDALEEALPAMPDWKVVFVGANRPGKTGATTEFEQRILDKISVLGDRIELKFFTPYDEVLELYKQAKISVMPSIWDEPFGRTALEAIASGAALITTGKGGIKDICKDVAIIEPDLDTTKLAGLLINLIGDEEKMQFLQKAGYERAKTVFDIQKLGERLDSCRT